MRYQGVLFDLDGTLINSAQDMYIALNLTLTEVAFPIVSYAQVSTWVGNGIDMLVKRGLSGGIEINTELPQVLVDVAIATFKGHYKLLAGQYVNLYPNVVTGLAALSGFSKSVVTNKDRMFTEPLLERLKLTSHFEVLVCGDDGLKKPAAQPLLQACEKMGLKPHEVIMVGDSKSDILAAHNANIDVIALTYGYHQGVNLQEFNPQYLCDDFLDIIPILTQR
ncbi:Phosphoglycolate phosphatase [Pseudoalteromonas sp. CIP111854]|uniref:phosphoglycolate phosphatase n=1 Tax=Pseudoalteromonas holothuriae TaxID=2963714 RepID=A0A9W4VPY6_9GAMM|nr:HAD family hydrolase [Pseudoalteromonas sp. CIP111854]CAH9055055.1 Phosphoglycolate phosphatase [Pseudoalteromonas sp. CIP111854]